MTTAGKVSKEGIDYYGKLFLPEADTMVLYATYLSTSNTHALDNAYIIRSIPFIMRRAAVETGEQWGDVNQGY